MKWEHRQPSGDEGREMLEAFMSGLDRLEWGEATFEYRSGSTEIIVTLVGDSKKG